MGECERSPSLLEEAGRLGSNQLSHEHFQSRAARRTKSNHFQATIFKPDRSFQPGCGPERKEKKRPGFKKVYNARRLFAELQSTNVAMDPCSPMEVMWVTVKRSAPLRVAMQQRGEPNRLVKL